MIFGSGTKEQMSGRKKQALQIFPNPSFNTVNIIYNSTLRDKLFITVKNALGKVIYSEQDTDFSGSYNKTIDLSNNAKGIYFIEIICGNNSTVKKVVLE